VLQGGRVSGGDGVGCRACSGSLWLVQNKPSGKTTRTLFLLVFLGVGVWKALLSSSDSGAPKSQILNR
jgi:hypothetical protein